MGISGRSPYVVQSLDTARMIDQSYPFLRSEEVSFENLKLKFDLFLIDCVRVDEGAV